jgi:hypothetical protein
MRYYKILISVPTGMSGAGNILVPNVDGKPGFTPVEPNSVNLSSYTSLNIGANIYTPGGTNPGAQQFDCDIPQAPMHLAQAGSFFRIWGVSLAELQQASNLNRMNVAIYAGMAVGLPLANPQQVGPIAQGQIIRSQGLWVSTDQALECYLYPGGSSPSSAQTTGNPNTAGTGPIPAINETPANIVFQWKAGQPLMAALVPALQVAFPQYTIQGAVSPNLVWTGAPSTAFFSTLKQLAQWINQKTLSIISGFAPALYVSPPSYPGVSITLQNGVLTISDGTVQTPPKAVQFTDLIGQPNWDGINTVTAFVVLRGDIGIGDYITLPNTVFTLAGNNTVATGTNSYNNLKLGSVFKGAFKCTGVRHVGNSRGLGKTDWCTVLTLVNTITPTSTVNAYPIIVKGQQLSITA